MLVLLRVHGLKLRGALPRCAGVCERSMPLPLACLPHPHRASSPARGLGSRLHPSPPLHPHHCSLHSCPPTSLLQGVFPSKGLGSDKGLGRRQQTATEPTLFMGGTQCEWIIDLGAQPSISLLVDYPYLGNNNTVLIESDTGFSARLTDNGPGLFQKRVAASNVTIRFIGGKNSGFSNFTFGWQVRCLRGGVVVVQCVVVQCVVRRAEILAGR